MPFIRPFFLRLPRYALCVRARPYSLPDSHTTRFSLFPPCSFHSPPSSRPSSCSPMPPSLRPPKCFFFLGGFLFCLRSPSPQMICFHGMMSVLVDKSQFFCFGCFPFHPPFHFCLRHCSDVSKFLLNCPVRVPPPLLLAECAFFLDLQLSPGLGSCFPADPRGRPTSHFPPSPVLFPPPSPCIFPLPIRGLRESPLLRLLEEVALTPCHFRVR